MNKRQLLQKILARPKNVRFGDMVTLTRLITIRCLADPIHAKLLLGEARLLRTQVPVTVKIGDHKLQNVCCFVEPGEFRNHRSKGLVLGMEHRATAPASDIRCLTRTFHIRPVGGHGSPPGYRCGRERSHISPGPLARSGRKLA